MTEGIHSIPGIQSAPSSKSTLPIIAKRKIRISFTALSTKNESNNLDLIPASVVALRHSWQAHNDCILYATVSNTMQYTH